MTTRIGTCPPSRRVVNRGPSRRACYQISIPYSMSFCIRYELPHKTYEKPHKREIVSEARF